MSNERYDLLVQYVANLMSEDPNALFRIQRAVSLGIEIAVQNLDEDQEDFLLALA